VLTVLFAIVAALAATSGLGVILNRRPLYAALSLVVNMLALAVLFLILSAQFLAAAQIIVYAGAVMVLFVFVIALLNPRREERPLRGDAQVVAALGVGALFILLSAVGLFASRGFTTFSAHAGAGLGSIQGFGNVLYRDFGFPFEATSLLLVVAAVGAVYLSRGR